MGLWKTTCARCGGPLPSFDPEAHCGYCQSLQPRATDTATQPRAGWDGLKEDPDGNGVQGDLVRTEAAGTVSSRHGRFPRLWLGLALGGLSLVGYTAYTAASKQAAREELRQAAGPSRALEPTPPAWADLPVAPPPEVRPAPMAPAPPPPPVETAPAPRRTRTLSKEAWAQQVVASHGEKLQECVEQDLLRFPDAPTGYSVTLLIESDATPRNSATRFTPEPSAGFNDCARLVLFYGFNEAPSSPPLTGDFRVTASFSFPNAKPARQAQRGRGWD